VNERGLAESTQWAVILPTLLAVMLGLVQTGVWLHGRTVATQAAGAAADAAAMGLAMEPAAVSIAAQGGLTDIAVRTSRSAGAVTVTVTGRVPTFLDVGQGQVSGQAIVPLEKASEP
jgi:Flp pilus assembly protein TadG